MTLVGVLADNIGISPPPLFKMSRHKLLKYHYHCLYQRTDCHICFLCFLICRSLSYFLGLTSIHKTEIFQQKGLGVSHNSPQADKVLPWSIQLSKNNCLTAFKKGDFKLYSMSNSLLSKNKKTDLPLLYKGKSVLIYKAIISKNLPTTTSVFSIYYSYAIV